MQALGRCVVGETCKTPSILEAQEEERVILAGQYYLVSFHCLVLRRLGPPQLPRKNSRYRSLHRYSATKPVSDPTFASGWSREHRHVTEEIRNKAYAEYGRTEGPGCCEVDHLIPLELGGSNDMKNLWPEPDDPRPGQAEKDSLENDLHARVCKGEISLADAQKCIASNWVKCWKKYVVPEYGSEWAAANRHGW